MSRSTVEPTAPPAARVALLGASNLSRSLPAAVAVARAALGSPLDVLEAAGFGRSYGWPTTMLGRGLPGILDCQLWEAIRSPPRLDAAVLTDIGNDLLYGATPRQIAQWIAKCLGRLTAAGARVIVTQLPLASLRKMPPLRYAILRRVLYPRSRLTLDEGLRRSVELNDRVCELATAHGADVVEPEVSWYGFDRIHVRRRAFFPAWEKNFSPLTGRLDNAITTRFSWRERWSFHRRQFHQHRKFGIQFACQQPSARVADGSAVSLF